MDHTMENVRISKTYPILQTNVVILHFWETVDLTIFYFYQELYACTTTADVQV